jgi:hypothetical protein
VEGWNDGRVEEGGKKEGKDGITLNVER